MAEPTTADWLAAFAQLDRMPLVDWTTAPPTCTVASNPTERNHMTDPDPMHMPPKMLRLAHRQRAAECLERAENFVAIASGDFEAVHWAAVAGLAGLSAAHFAAADAVELVPHQ
jgi:hypothetical protein